MKAMHKVYFILSLALVSMLGCVVSAIRVAGTPVPPTLQPAATEPLLTEAPPASLAPETQPASPVSVYGSAIFDDGENLSLVNLDTGESGILISRSEVQQMTEKDRSLESYTYGYERPVEIALSPDRTKALVTICAGLDERYRCVFSSYVYDMRTKTALKLPVPPESYGVHWLWSPDGTKLAGTSWAFVRAEYVLKGFYVVNGDSTNLKPLSVITNEHWRIAWLPGGGAFAPLTFLTNFKAIQADDSGEIEIPVEGLEWNDKFECLAFSPQNDKVAFVIRREQSRNHDWLFMADSNFNAAAQLTEFNIDSRYHCAIAWSPDARYVHLRYEYDPFDHGFELDKEGRFEPQDRIFSVETGSPLELPANSLACAWTADGRLAYETSGLPGAPSRVSLLDLSTMGAVSLPEQVDPLISHCPLLWVE